MVKRKSKKLLNNSLKDVRSIIDILGEGLFNTVINLGKSVSDIVKNIGDTANKLGVEMEYTLKNVGENLGEITNKTIETLGKPLKKIPILGDTAGYLVQGTKKGVYHLVITISDVGGLLGKTAGNLVSNSSKILVVTLKSSEDLVSNIQSNSLKLLKNTTDRIRNTIKVNGKKSKRKARGRSRSRTKGSKKRK